MWKLVFSYVTFEGWAIDPDAHGLLDGPSDAMYLPLYNGEAVYTDRMSNGQALCDRWGKGF